MTRPHDFHATLVALLQQQRVAALGSLGDDGAPLVSMVPFAIDAAAAVLVIHVSALAAHTANLRARPGASLLVMQAERAAEPVHALPRVTIQGQARMLAADTGAWRAARATYLARFPEAEPMTELADFCFVAIDPGTTRVIAGFGAARTVPAGDLAPLLRRIRAPDKPA